MSMTAPPATSPPPPTSTRAGDWLEAATRRLFQPVDIGLLVFFRVAFGLIMLVEAGRFFAHGWVYRNYIEPDFHFTMLGFSWVKPWPGDGMYLTFAAMGVLGLMIAAGLFYRVATVLFFLNFAHVFFVEEAYYLNHFYLITLISFLICFLPLNRAWSLDVALRPSLYSATAPTWTLWLLRLQLGIAYFYGGIAKINPDWLHGEPMRSTLVDTAHRMPFVGRFFHEEWAVWFFSIGGLAFDLLIVPALQWPRTRWLAFAAALIFNLSNSLMFDIGIFPWFMMAATMMFFPPDWVKVTPWPRAAATDAPKRGSPHRSATTPVPDISLTSPGRKKLIVALLAVWTTVQLLVPFRHLLYPGDVSWTEEGHYFAWHMKLRKKFGTAVFTAVTADGTRLPETVLVKHASPELTERMLSRLEFLSDADRRQPPGRFLYISGRQRKKMCGRPDMIHQYAKFLASEFERHGYGKVAILVDSSVSLNNRAPQPLVDPDVDLAAEPRGLGLANWIVPLTQPLKNDGGATSIIPTEAE